MRVLGAIVAGGEARRFGGDKGAAKVDGKALIDHVASALRPHAQTLVIVGRDWPGLQRIEDWPTAGLGPMGGIAGAMAHAHAAGFDAVLTASCDAYGLNDAHIASLHPGPAVLAAQPVIGLWPVTLLEPLQEWIRERDKHPVWGFVDHIGARRVDARDAPGNINCREDLETLRGNA